MNDVDVREPAGVHGALQIAAAPDRALDQRHAGITQRRRQGQPRPPRTRAEIGDPPRIAHRRQLQRHERIGDVPVHGLGRVPDRRKGPWINGLQLENRRNAGQLDAEAGAERGDFT